MLVFKKIYTVHCRGNAKQSIIDMYCYVSERNKLLEMCFVTLYICFGNYM